MTARSPQAWFLVDVGTSALKGRVLIDDSGEVAAESTMASSIPRQHNLRAELDASVLVANFRELISQLAAQAEVSEGQILVSTQMHTAVLTDQENHPISPMISWQDDRLLEAQPDGESELEALLRAAPEGAWRRSGMAERPGFGAGNLGRWLRENPRGPREQLHVHTVGSYLSSVLGGPYTTHRSNAASLGVLNIDGVGWDEELVALHGLLGCVLPVVHDFHQPQGVIEVDGVSLVWLGDIGDHQAAVLGGGGLAPTEVGVSLGTAGIAARLADRPHGGARVDSRPYVDGRYLQAVSRLPGGSFAATFATFLADLVHEVGGRRVSTTELLALTATIPVEALDRAVLEGSNPGIRDLLEGHRGRDVTALQTFYRLLLDHYVRAYAEAIDILFEGAELPTSIQFNGGFASRNATFRSYFSDGLGLQIADVPEGDLALRGLQHLARQHLMEGSPA